LFSKISIHTFGDEKHEAWAVAATTADRASTLANRIASELVMGLACKQARLDLPNPVERLERLLLVYLTGAEPKRGKR
jgi:hypothetical protein